MGKIRLCLCNISKFVNNFGFTFRGEIKFESKKGGEKMKQHLSIDELLESDFDCEIDDINQSKVNHLWFNNEPLTYVAVIVTVNIRN